MTANCETPDYYLEMIRREEAEQAGFPAFAEQAEAIFQGIWDIPEVRNFFQFDKSQCTITVRRPAYDPYLPMAVTIGRRFTLPITGKIREHINASPTPAERFRQIAIHEIAQHCRGLRPSPLQEFGRA